MNLLNALCIYNKLTSDFLLLCGVAKCGVLHTHTFSPSLVFSFFGSNFETRARAVSGGKKMEQGLFMTDPNVGFSVLPPQCRRGTYLEKFCHVVFFLLYKSDKYFNPRSPFNVQ